jgi:proline dehydrogenase
MMLRSFFVGLSKAAWAQRLVTSWGFARRAARRFVAGETQLEAIEVVRQLNARGINASLDHLGENTNSLEAARSAAAEILELLELVQSSGVKANVSIKLSQIGLGLDEEFCRGQLGTILEKARSLGNFVRIDMEDSGLADRTLQEYFWALENGFHGQTGIVLQAYLYRTVKDLTEVLERGGRIRLCKGAYKEPEAVAFPRKADVDLNFDQLTLQLLRGSQKGGAAQLSPDGRVPPVPAIATHDSARIDFARRAVRELSLPHAAVEFQMLYGIRRDLQTGLAAEGFPVRVYVPYGTHWYPYFMRRLGERPANIWFFVSNFLRR